MALARDGEVVPARLPNADRQRLAAAWLRLEQMSFAVRVSRLLGQPLDAGLERLPPALRERLGAVTERALEDALDVAVRSLNPLPARPPRQRLACVGLGAAGGLFGPAGLVIELPLTTVVLLRAIAGVALEEGENLDELEARLACLDVLSLTGPAPWSEDADPGWFELRTSLAARYALSGGLASSVATTQAVQALARRFGVVVTQKAAARALPVIGAATGAGLNALFFDHYLETARGLFVRRALERRYGRLLVEEEYARIGAERAARMT